MEIRRIESQIEGSQATFGFQSMRLKAREERLAHLRKQADHSTIRAPHDGRSFTYPPSVARHAAAGRYRSLSARELFFLPDLSRMEVQVAIHESVGSGCGSG